MRLSSLQDRPSGPGGPWSPVVRRLLFLHDLDPEDVPVEGHRLTRRRLEAFLRDRPAAPAARQPSSAPATRRPGAAEIGQWRLLEREVLDLGDDARLLHVLVTALAGGASALSGRDGWRLSVREGRSGRTSHVEAPSEVNLEGFRRRLGQDGGEAAAGPADVVVVTDLPPGVTVVPQPEQGAVAVVSVGGARPTPVALATSDGGTAVVVRDVRRVQLLVDTARMPLSEALDVLDRVR